MGNCLETCVHRRRREAIENGQDEKASRLSPEKAAGSGAGDSNLLREKTGMRIKIVLTKEELEWLLIQLEDDRQQGQGRRQRSLEDVLDEIERGRRIRSTVGWKPSLESIIESPEVPAEQISTR